MSRIVGVGPLTLGGYSFGDLSSWDGNVTANLDEIKNLRAAVQDRLVKNTQWDIKVERELSVTGKDIGAMSVGSWTGVQLVEYTFKAELPMKEAEGAFDLWREFCPGATLDWSLDVTKWQATDSFEIMLAMMKSQATARVPVSIVTPYGSGLALVDKDAFGANADPADEKFSAKAKGTLTSSDTWVSQMISTAASVMNTGAASPQACSGYIQPSGAPIAGNVFLKSVEYKVPAGKVTSTLELQGTGAPS
jgi:hypothetical protein